MYANIHVHAHTLTLYEFYYKILLIANTPYSWCSDYHQPQLHTVVACRGNGIIISFAIHVSGIVEILSLEQARLLSITLRQPSRSQSPFSCSILSQIKSLHM